MMKFFKTFLVGISVFFSGCAKDTLHVEAVKNFDINRYMGTWYEIARLPHSFEKDMDRVSALYKLDQNQEVEVTNSGYKNGVFKQAKGVARFKGEKDIGHLEVSFFRPFYEDYKIVYLESNYSCALVTSSTMEYFWILCKEPKLDEKKMKKYLDMAQNWRFEVEKLEYPNH